MYADIDLTLFEFEQNKSINLYIDELKLEGINKERNKYLTLVSLPAS